MSLFKKNAGFTLVELIVVIAILGILATVAIPSYNGYIEKAQIAGDQQELHNLNLAFIAACAEEGESNIGRTDVSVSLNAGKAVVTIGNADIAANFAGYYEAGEFKYYTALHYIKATGEFSDEAPGLMSDTGYRKEYADAAKDYYDSDNSYLGAEDDLLDTVSTFSTALSDFLNDDAKKEKLLSDPKFAAFLEANSIPEDNTEMIGKAMVLYAAQELSDVNPSAIHTGLVSGYDAANNSFDLFDMSTIMHGEDVTPAELALDGAALAAVIAGYVNSDYATQAAKDYFTSEQESVKGAGTLITYLNGVVGAGVTTDENGVKNDSFAQYLNSSQATTDIQAFTGGLGAVHYGSEDVLDAFVNDGDLDAVLEQILTGQWSGAEG